MLNFSEYKKHEYLPVVYFDIHRETERPLLEELHAYDPPHFLGTVHDLPENNGFTEHERVAGVYTHPDHSGIHFVFHGNTAVPVGDLEDAQKHLWNMDAAFTTSTQDIASKLIPIYSPTNYDESDLDAIKQYTKYSSGINRSLLKHQNLNDRMNAIVASMDKTLQKIKTPDSIVVYTGTNSDHAKKLMSGGKVEHPGFLSTSLNIMKAKQFADTGSGHIIRIDVPSGHAGIYAQKFSKFPEQEFILPRGLILNIDKSKQMMFREVGDPNKVVVHHATIV